MLVRTVPPRFVETGKEPIRVVYKAAQSMLFLGMACYFSNFITAIFAQLNVGGALGW